MTARRSGRRNGTRKRTGRNVWVNNDVNLSPTLNAFELKDILENAPDFMTFDTTIVSVIIESLNFTYDSLAPAGVRRMAIALIVAPESITTSQLDPILFDGVEGFLTL